VDVKIDLSAHGTPETPLGHQHAVRGAGEKPGFEHELFRKTGPAFIKNRKLDMAPDRSLVAPAAGVQQVVAGKGFMGRQQLVIRRNRRCPPVSRIKKVPPRGGWTGGML
jgi:hypothetical protein